MYDCPFRRDWWRPSRCEPEEFTRGLVEQDGAVHFAVQRVSRNVRCPQRHYFNQRRVRVRFIFPYIKNRPTQTPFPQRAQEGPVVNHGASRRIHDHGTRPHLRKGVSIEQVIRRIRPLPRERNMTGDNVALGEKCLQRHKPRASRALQRRIIREHGHSQSPSFLLNQDADEAEPDDPHGPSGPMAEPQGHQCGDQILSRGIGIAPRCVGECDLTFTQVVLIHMV